MAKSKTARLQEILEDLLVPGKHGEWNVVYRPGSGYWMEPEESRYFGDEGEFLGEDFETAAKTILLLIG